MYNLAYAIPPAGKIHQPAGITFVFMNTFDTVAEQALTAMQKRAAELNVKGVAVVAASFGGNVQSWSSKMLVVGQMKGGPSTDFPTGINLVGIAYSKAAEMADTLQDSGSGARVAMKGEYGWEGGVIGRGKSGWLFAAFSGGISADDVKISKSAMAILTASL
jgi:hypothetical protein